MGYNLLINGVYWGYNPLTNHLLTSWDIQAGGNANVQELICWPFLSGAIFSWVGRWMT